jgi:hypothetical protein
MVIIMMLVMSVNPVAAVVSQPGIIVSPVMRIATLIPIRIIPVIPWIAVLAAPVGQPNPIPTPPTRLKPERQQVSPEPEPVRLLPMDVKRFFHRIFCFLFVPFRGDANS